MKELHEVKIECPRKYSEGWLSGNNEFIEKRSLSYMPMCDYAVC